MKKILVILFVISALSLSAKRILILDYNAEVIDEIQKSSFLNMFSDEIINYGYSSTIQFDSLLKNYWNDSKSLIEKNTDNSFSDVVIFKYYVLGEKFVLRMSVFSYEMNEFVRNEEFIVYKPEELKSVSKRASLVIAKNKSIKELVEVGIVQSDEVSDMLENRQNGLTSFSAGFGYLWATPPTRDELYGGKYKKVLMFYGSLFTEISRQARMDFNFEIPFLSSLAASIGYIYIFSPKTFTPYVGGDVGVEYVYIRKNEYPDSSIGGVFIKPRFGFLMMNTFNLSTYVEMGFRMVMTDFYDSGVEVKIGLQFRQPTR